MLVCAYNVHSCTRDRGCSAHPAFPAPSIFEGGKEFASLGRNRAARSRTRALSHVVPAKAGTHTPRRNCESEMVDGFASTTTGCGYGSLLSQGRRWGLQRLALAGTTEKSKLAVQPSRED